MWTVRLSELEAKLVAEGKTIEKLLEEGMVTIEIDAEGVLVIRFLTIAESGFGLRV